MSLHIHNLCEKNTSWINVYDNFSKKLEFNFTNNFYYFANLNYSLNEYDNNQLVFELKNYESLIKEIGNNKFSELKILVTGDGRVAKGVLELLQKTNITEISKEEYLYKKFSYPVFLN